MERGILYTTDMAEAIIDNRKTMTRRLSGLDKINESPDSWEFSGFTQGKGGAIYANFNAKIIAEPQILYTTNVRCPYGNIGDILYVRETWQHTRDAINLSQRDENSGYIYKASENGRDWEFNTEEWKWKPGIHLPKEGSRIWLQITDIKVERVQNISPEDAVDEGILYSPDKQQFYHYITSEWVGAKESFISLWDKINGEKYPWESNPWVWCVRFKVLSTTGKPNIVQNDERSVATDA